MGGLNGGRTLNLLPRGGKKFDKKGRNNAKMERLLKNGVSKSRGAMDNGEGYDAVSGWVWTLNLLHQGGEKKFDKVGGGDKGKMERFWKKRFAPPLFPPGHATAKWHLVQQLVSVLQWKNPCINPPYKKRWRHVDLKNIFPQILIGCKNIKTIFYKPYKFNQICLHSHENFC